MLANGNKWQDTARKQLCAAASSPFICQALAWPLSQIFLFWRALSACPLIGHSVTGRPTKRRRGACGRGDGLTLHRPLSGFVYRTLSLLPLVKRRQVKNTTDREGREMEGGGRILSSICLHALGVFEKVFRLVREELRWGSVLQAGCSVGVLS